jgi:hypothetical protein
MPKAKEKNAKTLPECINGKFMVSFGAKENLSPDDIACLEEIVTWSDVAVGRIVKHQAEKLLKEARDG